MNVGDLVSVPFNVACGRRVTLNQLLEELHGLLDSDVEAVRAPPRPGEVRHSVADVSRAEQVLGWEPQVDLREGLRRTIEHFRAEPVATGEVTAR